MSFTMIILTLWVTGLGLLSSSSSITLEKWLNCQIGWPSWLSRDSWVGGAQHDKMSTMFALKLRTYSWTRLSHLQHQWHARREEGHKHKVVGQDGHATEAAHDFQLPHTWKTKEDTFTRSNNPLGEFTERQAVVHWPDLHIFIHLFKRDSAY